MTWPWAPSSASVHASSRTAAQQLRPHADDGRDAHAARQDGGVSRRPARRRTQPDHLAAIQRGRLRRGADRPPRRWRRPAVRSPVALAAHDAQQAPSGIFNIGGPLLKRSPSLISGDNARASAKTCAGPPLRPPSLVPRSGGAVRPQVFVGQQQAWARKMSACFAQRRLHLFGQVVQVPAMRQRQRLFQPLPFDSRIHGLRALAGGAPHAAGRRRRQITTAVPTASARRSGQPGEHRALAVDGRR